MIGSIIFLQAINKWLAEAYQICFEKKTKPASQKKVVAGAKKIAFVHSEASPDRA